MSISRSRAPKGKRTAREFEVELLPVPGDYFHTARYIDRRAELGDFTGKNRKDRDDADKNKPATALKVLHYLWRHTARKSDHPTKLSSFERIGWVLSGKSKIGKIATECGISYNAARTTLYWLAEEEWIDIDHGNDQIFDIRVKMRLEDHNERMTLMGQPTVTFTGTVTEDDEEPCQPMAEGVPTNGTVISMAGTAPASEWHTQQGGLKGFERDSYSEGPSAHPAASNNPKPQIHGGAAPTPPSEDESGKSSSGKAMSPGEDLDLARKHLDEAQHDLDQAMASGQLPRHYRHLVTRRDAAQRKVFRAAAVLRGEDPVAADQKADEAASLRRKIAEWASSLEDEEFVPGTHAEIKADIAKFEAELHALLGEDD
jgi:hypothetical protein